MRRADAAVPISRASCVMAFGTFTEKRNAFGTLSAQRA
jgi:hypothetical protein